MITVLAPSSRRTAPVVVSGGGGSFFTNRPPTWTNSAVLDFSQAMATPPDGQDRPIIGTDWQFIEFGTPFDFTADTDATAIQSPPSIFKGHWTADVYPGGHGIGNFFTRGPSNLFLTSPITHVYLSLTVYFDFPDASFWHPVSNKFINLQCNNSSQILMQLRENDDWRHLEELATGGTNIFVDNHPDQGSDDHIAGQLDNRDIPIKQWLNLEFVVDIPNHVFKAWQDGVLTSSATPNFTATNINTVGVNAHRGGGGETLTSDLFYRYDHFLAAW